MAIQQKIPTPQEVKSSPTSFTEQELNQLKDLRTKLNQVTVKFGQVKISQIKLKETEESLKKQLADLEKQEVDIAKSLSNKYGKGSINIETGTFTPSE
jgi:predicted FMN-binding regulatory protein PaiB